MKYFGTDGIRQKAKAFLENQFAQKVGMTLPCLGNAHLIIAQDSRESSEAIKQMLVMGAKAKGMRVYDLGMLPTPVLAFLSATYETLGVMITASHNPYQDNGIKILKNGYKLKQEEEMQIEQMIDSNHFNIECTLPKEKEISILPYVEKYRKLQLSSQLKVGFDVANGAGSIFVPSLVKQFVKTAQFIHVQPDGRNINEQCGSTHLDSIRAFVKAKNLDIGFALDGDGDRVLVVDKEGRVYDGDAMIYIFANYLKQIGKLKKQSVVLSIMSNLGVIQALKKDGIQVISTPVGDKYIMDTLEKDNLTLGGEASGHVINKYLLNSGDGTLNALFLLKIVQESGKSLAELTQKIVSYPEKLVNLKNMDRAILQKINVKSTILQYQTELGDDARIIVRASGTEPLIRVSICAKEQQIVDSYIDKIVTLLRKEEK